MMIDGIPAKQLVQQSVNAGLVKRPANLQKTLAPAEKQQLENIIQAARRRLAERQKRQADVQRVRQLNTHSIIIDGHDAKEIAAKSIQMGLARLKSRGKIFSFAEREARKEQQRTWVRESTRRWRAKKKAALSNQPNPSNN